MVLNTVPVAEAELNWERYREMVRLNSNGCNVFLRDLIVPAMGKQT